MKCGKKLIFIIWVVTFSGCAMITKGPIEEVTFSGNKDSMDVYINNKSIGQAPTTIELWKLKKNQATFYIPNEQEEHYSLKTHINALILNNAIFLLVDPFLGIATFGNWARLSGKNIF